MRYKLINTISWQMERSQELIYILNHMNGQYYELEEVGKDIWLMIEKQVEVDEMIKNLMGKYEIKKEVLRADVEELLRALVREDLISPVYE